STEAAIAITQQHRNSKGVVVGRCQIWLSIFIEVAYFHPHRSASHRIGSSRAKAGRRARRGKGDVRWGSVGYDRCGGAARANSNECTRNYDREHKKRDDGKT